MDKYLEYYKIYLQSLNKSANTIKQYCIDIIQFNKFLDDQELSLGTKTEETVLAYKNYLMEYYRVPSSINRKLASLKDFLYFLNARNVVEEVPDKLLKPITVSKQRIQTHTKGQMYEILQASYGFYQHTNQEPFKWLALRNFCIVTLMASFGLKPSEVIAMKWSHINKNEMTIINGKKFRRLILSEELLALLSFYYDKTKMQFPAYDLNSFLWIGKGSYQNEGITVKTIERIFKRISSVLGYKVTATSVRYSTLGEELSKSSNRKIEDIFKNFGYSRKSVLVDRVNRMKLNKDR